MTIFQSVILGIVQGLGEFLPISSSAHLIVVPWILGWEDPGLAFDVALHLGTFFAVAYAFMGEWLALGKGAVRAVTSGRWLKASELKTLLLIVLASIPGAIAGLKLDHWAETTLRAPALIATAMTLLAIVLWIADRKARPAAGELPALPQISFGTALLIGLAQCLAIIPGVSRSGSTISAGLLLGVERREAARFSFLLATPITAGAALYKVPALLKERPDLAPILVGIAVAAIVGFLAIKVLLAYVRTKDYTVFVYYRLAFAALVFGLLWLRH